LAPLDLTDVLLREPLPRQLRLCHAGRNTQLPEPLTQPKTGLGHGCCALDEARMRHMRRSRRHASQNLKVSERTSPKKGMSRRISRSTRVQQNHLTELLDMPARRPYSEAILQPSQTPGSAAGGALPGG